ncbi:transposase [Streptomyces sp. NBC_00268]|uniref:transposase n=1 Tax=Streptomyces sp. NBC_00268 TaxID=2975695 RepID=UPI002B1E63D3|nr:transposase [Streptomyces sp. NBC_00268]
MAGCPAAVACAGMASGEGRPDGCCHRVMLDAIRYVVDDGVKWANPPTDLPSYRRVHAFARRWRLNGLLVEFHDRLRDRVRERRPGQHLGHRHPGIHQPLKRAFGVAKRGRPSLGLLPQPCNLFPDPLLPGLQQTEHRRERPPPRARRTDEPHPLSSISSVVITTSYQALSCWIAVAQFSMW